MLRPIPQLVEEIRSSLRCVSADQAMQEIAGNGGALIDVREGAEVEQKPAPRSLSIPRGVLEMVVMNQFPDHEHPIYLHCASGVRATLAADSLQRLGYQNVSVVTCSIDNVCSSQCD